MESIIYRERRLKHFIYEAESHDLSGESNYTFGIALSKIKASRGSEQFAVIQEKFILLKLLCKLLFNLIQLAPYELRYETEKPSRFRVSVSFSPKISGKMGKHFFELSMHSGNVCSLMKDNIQIARLKKRAKSEFEKNVYEVLYLSEDDFEFCFLFCMLADVLWFKDDAKCYAVRYETGFVPFDDCSERANWTP